MSNIFHACNGLLHLRDGEMDFIRFGTGEQPLILLPGVGDGFKTVKGMALPFAFLYRALVKDFTVYGFSRRRELAPHTTTREMAADLALAMEILEIPKASIVGISQGGMVAQWLAIDHPEKVEKLVLAVTLSRPNPTVKEAVEGWLAMAEDGDYKSIMLDTAERSYTPKRLRTARVSYSLLANVSKPKSFERFTIQAESCLSHDAYEELPKITCPTLVVGGSEDRIVTAAASEEIAEQIPGSKLAIYEGLSHGLYEEAPDFWENVRAFCSSNSI